MKKYCPKCKKKKDENDFSKDRQKPGGRYTYCRPCKSKYNRECGGLAFSRDWHFRKKYGITAEQRDQMAADQKGLCASCLEPRKLMVDHDHRTGKVRELLCGPCNRALGYLYEDPVKIVALRDYLLKHS
jgi:hypothetical protein